MKSNVSSIRPISFSIITVLFLLASSAFAITVPQVTLYVSEVDHVVTTDVCQLGIQVSSGDGIYQLNVRVVGWDGATVFEKNISGVSGGGSQTLTVPSGKFGSYDVMAELRYPGTMIVASSDQTRYVRPIPVDTLTAQQRRGSYIGINTHIGTHWKTLEKFGIHWARHYAFGWLGSGSVAPRSSNGYNFLTIWNEAKAANITILPCMQQAYWNTAKTNYRTDLNYITTAYDRILRSLPEIEFWELDNEAKYNFLNKGTSVSAYHTAYRNYIHAAAAGVALAGGGRHLILDGTAGIQLDTNNEMLKTSGVSPVVAGEFYAVNYHDYCYYAAPELNTSMISKMTQANNTAHAAGKEAWFTEFGWTEKYDFGVGLHNQAAYMVRIHLLARKLGVDKAFWFWDRDLEGTNWIATMGVIDINNIARPLGPAFAAMSRFIAINPLIDSGELGPDAWYTTFQQPDGSSVMAAWTLRLWQPFDTGNAAAAYDMFGNRIPTGLIEIGPEPIYLVYTQPGVNLPPAVDAGEYQFTHTPSAVLNGVVLDDGVPSAITATWTKVSGPGSVTFADASQPGTTATFSEVGTYVLRLTASDGSLTSHDEVTISYEPEPAPMHGPILVFDKTELGGGLTGWTFRIANDDGLLLSYAFTLAFEGAGSGTIRQMGYSGSVPVHSETLATAMNGLGTPVYFKAEDSWAYVPFADNPIPGVDPRNGSTVFSGFVEQPNLYLMSLASGAGSLLGNNVPAVYIVSEGNVQWAGVIARNAMAYGTSGMTDLVISVAIPGDFNLDGVVDLADYTVWADSFGQTGSDLPADGNGDGVVDLADYTVWADHFGMGAAMTAEDAMAPISLPVSGYAVTGGAAEGDFNNDGVVNQADYTVWADSFGQIGSDLPADGNGDGVVDMADYTLWSDRMNP